MHGGGRKLSDIEASEISSEAKAMPPPKAKAMPAATSNHCMGACMGGVEEGERGGYVAVRQGGGTVVYEYNRVRKRDREGKSVAYNLKAPKTSSMKRKNFPFLRNVRTTVYDDKELKAMHEDKQWRVMPPDPPSPPPHREVPSSQANTPTLPVFDSPFVTYVEDILNNTTFRKIPRTPLPPQTPLPIFNTPNLRSFIDTPIQSPLPAFNTPKMQSLSNTPIQSPLPAFNTPNMQSLSNTPIQSPKIGSSTIRTNSPIPEMARSIVDGTPGWLQNCKQRRQQSEPVDSGSENAVCESVMDSPVLAFQTPKPGGLIESIEW
jgi:hypothetical protein